MSKTTTLPLEEFQETATYKSPKDTPKRTFELEAAIRWAHQRWVDNPDRPMNTLRFIGKFGIGKTKKVTDAIEKLGHRVVVKSLSQTDMTSFLVPFPEDTDQGAVLRLMLLDELRQLDDDDTYVIVLDEYSRADKSVQNVAMEITGQRTLAGMPLKGCVAVIVLDNPAGDGDYHGIAGLDLAQADRFNTWEVEADSIDWEYYLSTVYPEKDLKDFFKAWWAQDAQIRDKFPPRVIEHFLRIVLFHETHGGQPLPAIWALPVLANGRVKLMLGDKDMTVQVLSKFCEALGVPYVDQDRISGHVAQVALNFAAATNSNIRMIGPQGCGKTGFTAAYLENELNLHTESFSLPMTSPEDWVVPAPANGRLNHIVVDRLTHDKDWVMIADEASRAPRRTAAAFMEISGERSISGKPLENLRFIVALDNPAAVGNIRFDAGRLDIAQATRYVATIEVTHEDIPVREFLDGLYGEAAQPFSSWWHEDLDDDARAFVSFRCLERMITLEQGGLPCEAALPHVDGERVPVLNFMHLLKARLKNTPVAGFGSIVKNVDEYVKRLSGDKDEPTEAAVLFAFKRADLVELRKHEDACRKLIPLLAADRRINLVKNTKGDKQRFWSQVLREAMAAKK